MKILFYDFETYYDREYSLSKMSPAEYILDYRFESLGCGFDIPGKAPLWVDGPDLPDFFEEVDWADTYAVAHNALFDACILKWKYNVNPKMLGDTIAMARNMVWHETGSVALATLAKHFGLPPKMATLHRTLGKRLADIMAEPDTYDELRAYGPDDAAKCRQLFTAMNGMGFPASQLPIIDRQIRMATEPKFIMNQQILVDHHAKILADKSEMLAKLGMTLEDKGGLMSNDALALLLLSHGVEPPTKVSAATKKDTYAFAKTDEEFTDLLDHPDPTVQAIVGARLSVKSTAEETRTVRFMKVGNLPWPPWENPQSMPIPLKYSGAHTKRFSGDWQLNAQNLQRGSKLRYAMEVPEGQVVVSADASQIEARLTAGFARMNAEQKGHPFSTLIQQFAMNEDVYSTFASTIYNRAINRIEHPDERFVGKQGILSLGYSASWIVFQNMVRIKSEGKVILNDLTAIRTVDAYRAAYPEIVLLWRTAEDWLWVIANAKEDEWHQWGPLWIGKNVVVLPDGNRLNYRDLHQSVDEETGRRRWYYYFGKVKKHIYGAKLVENFIQALAFMLIMQADQRIAVATKGLVKLAHQVHDELIYVVLARHANAVKTLAEREISKKPDWMPWLPLAAEGHIGNSYGSVK